MTRNRLFEWLQVDLWNKAFTDCDISRTEFHELIQFASKQSVHGHIANVAVRNNKRVNKYVKFESLYVADIMHKENRKLDILVAEVAKGLEKHNINYVTDKMYENALVTAGMSDADVIVAAPTSISGTAALVGAMKAYAVISGDTVSATEIDTATDELVTTSQIASETGDSDKTTQLVAAVKQVVAEKNYTSESDITKVIKDVANQLGITLSDEEVQALADVMQKIAALNLDPDKLTEQVKSVYEAAAANGLDLSKYGITNDDVNGFFSKLSSVFRAVIDWIKGLTS